MSESIYKEIKFTDADIVNYDDFIAKGEYNPHNVRPFLLHDHGFVVAVVFADCLQDALDAAADADKLDRYLVSGDDYHEEIEDSYTYLGNASEPFDIEGLDAIELPIPPRPSFCDTFNLTVQQCQSEKSSSSRQNETPPPPPGDRTTGTGCATSAQSSSQT